MRLRLGHTALLLSLLPCVSHGQADDEQLSAAPPASPLLSRTQPLHPHDPGAQPGSAHAAAEGATEETTGPAHIYADAFLVWIYRKPERDPAPLGYLRAGQGALLREPRAISRRGCSGGWFPVYPAGFICKDRQTSFEPTRYSQAMSALSPEEGPYPFDFALSMGTPSYRKAPSSAEAERRERKFGEAKVRPLPPHWQGHEELVGAPVPQLAAPSWFLDHGGSVSRAEEQRLVRRDVPFGSMLAITGAFEVEGRAYLQSSDGTLVPAARMRMFRRSHFSGVDLGGSIQLPLAWTRKSARTYRLSPTCLTPEVTSQPNATSGFPAREPATPTVASGCLKEQPGQTSVREMVPLTGRQVRQTEDTYVETRNGHWLKAREVFVAQRHSPPAGENQWLHFSIGQGTLTAYEEGRPVFATLASPGIGGRPRDGGDPLADRTTPLGRYRIHFKHRSDDMSPEVGEKRTFWIADVPYAMYFKQPFAIHVAYWHEAFGEPMSGGCINVSPQDGARLFDWTTPHVPDDWYGASTSDELGLGTALTIER